MKLKTAFLAASAAAFTGLCAGFAACEAAAKNGNLSGEPDFLLILGCRVKGDTPDEMLRLRAKAAAKFLNEHKNVRAICCGGIVHEDQTKSEAQAIKEILLQNGIESERIFLEDKSQTTFENFVNAKKITDSLQTEKEPKIAFISSEFHLMRASVIASLVGVRASSIPAPSPKKGRALYYVYEGLVFPLLYREYLGKHTSIPSGMKII
ncbi:MAG: YdcF family protein [Clostridia bacterium]|nr:YdcF family protein [Clostridia bacterium]